jgi:dolichol-phosphate mannosyltransferase
MAAREVPPFAATVLAPRGSRVCCAIFVLNENGRLHAQLAKMRPFAGTVDLIVADGGSTDGSTDPAALQPAGVRALLVRQERGGLSAQMRMAFAWALDEGYESIITIDGNDKDDPAAIPRFVEALARGVDHVQGSRFVPGGRAVRTPLSRLVGIKLLHAPLLSLAAGARFTDTTNGFRAYSRRFLLDERVAPFRSVFQRYELHYYLAVRAAQLGFVHAEVPVTRAYPASGATPTKITPFRGNLLVLRTLLAACLHRFDPPPPPRPSDA